MFYTSQMELIFPLSIRPSAAGAMLLTSASRSSCMVEYFEYIFSFRIFISMEDHFYFLRAFTNRMNSNFKISIEQIAQNNNAK